MSFIESLSGPRIASATTVTMHERVSQASTPSVRNETQQAVRPSNAMDSARMMLEHRGTRDFTVPITHRTTLGSSGGMTAAYLTEMRLQQELDQVQETMNK